MSPVEQIVSSLQKEPEMWVQTEYTLAHKDGVEVWTGNVSFLNIGIYKPRRKLGLIDKIRLQLAVNRWHKKPFNIAN